MLKKTLIIVAFSVVFSSCSKDFLDQVPDDRLTIDQVFLRRELSERYLHGIYGYILDETNQWTGNPWMGASDEADMSWARVNYQSYFMNLGSWDATSGYHEFWGNYYKGIRAATYFIENVGENPEILQLANGRELLDRYIAEARALRAYFYFNLVRQYGPVIILEGDRTIPVDTPLEDLQLPRSSVDECVSYMVSELDKAAEDLPEWYDDKLMNDTDYGRVTSSFIKALKSRLLLYAASPLYNGNRDYASMVNADGKQLINEQYSEDKWKVAADAAKEVIDIERFSLFEVMKDGQIDAFVSYRDLFLVPWNSEVIFGRVDNGTGSWEQHSSPRFAGGWSGVAPTQRQVDAYHMSDGTRPILGYNSNGSPILNSQSVLYSETGFTNAASPDGYWREGTFNMWVNREPRFYVSVTFNGSEWINKDEGVKIVELYNRGNTGKAGSFDHSSTGYLIRKNIHPNTFPLRGRFIKRPTVYFRLGEVYLNYVEALNEYNPGNPDILKYLNRIRERAGIAQYGTGNGALAIPADQEAMREAIHRERRVELAFESFRYFDTRRWKIAEQTDAGLFQGMNIDEGTYVGDPEFHQRKVYEKRVFRKHFYLFPIPQTEIDRNGMLVQNIGW